MLIFKNIVVMKIKNKRESSIEYSKKRKLTLLNKDLNLLGKIFSDRFKIVIDRILPMCQYVCRSDVRAFSHYFRFLIALNMQHEQIVRINSMSFSHYK